MPERIVIIGATSGIGQALAGRLAQGGAHLALAGRDDAEIRRIADDLRHRHQGRVDTLHFEATDFDSHPAMLADAVERLGGLDGVIACQGTMADQREAEQDFALVQRMIDVNYTATVSILNLAPRHLEDHKRAYICGVSSVAGDRGRQSNFLYGSTKAAMSAYLAGLRNRLFKRGIHVLTAKPGIVDTAMTYGLVDPDSRLVAKPEQVAQVILRAIAKRKNTVYAPRYWWAIMAIIKRIPEFIFKRLSM